MIKAEDLKNLDERSLKWYRKQVAQFHQDCLQFDKCYRVPPVFHDHFQEIEKLLTDEIQCRKDKENERWNK